MLGAVFVVNTGGELWCGVSKFVSFGVLKNIGVCLGFMENFSWGR